MKGFDLTPADLRRLAKKKKVKKISSMTSKEYRELLKDKNRKPSPGQKITMSYSVEEINNGFLITVKGKHLSQNVLNGSGLKRRIQYKKAFKTGVENYLLMNRSKKIHTIEGKASIKFILYGPNIRDHDNNHTTMKTIQDTLTVNHQKKYGYGLGIIYDDDPKHLIPDKDNPTTKEDPEYKVEVFVTVI